MPLVNILNKVPEEKKPINTHDIVHLNSGGPEMYVISIDKTYNSKGELIGQAKVVYTNSAGEIKRTVFDLRMITFIRRIEG